MIEDLDKIKAKIVHSEGLLAYLMYNLRIYAGESGTAHTNGEDIIIDAEFWKTLRDDEKFGLLLHELMHIVFEHPWVFGRLEEKNQVLFNMVGDIVINKFLISKGYVVPRGGLKYFGQLGFHELDQESILEHTTVWFYEQILKKMPVIKIKVKCDCGGSGGNDGNNGEQKQKGGSEITVEINGREIKTIRDLEKCNKATKDRIKRIIDSAVSIYENLAKIGSLSAELCQYIKEFQKTKTDWKSVLRSYFNILKDDEYTYTKPKQKGNILRPSLKPMYENGVNLIMIVDSSGSISDETLHKFACEVYTLVEEYANEIYLIVNDADIKLEKKITSKYDIPNKFEGRGGTMFEKVIKRLREPIQIDDPVVVILTDGMIGDLDQLCRPPYEVIWMIIGQDKFKPPFGRVVYLDYNN